MFYNLLGLYEMLELECAGCSTKTWFEGCIGEKQNGFDILLHQILKIKKQF